MPCSCAEHDRALPRVVDKNARVKRSVEPVRQHVVELFDSLARVHELPEEYKLWLEAAAMMQDDPCGKEPFVPMLPIFRTRGMKWYCKH